MASIRIELDEEMHRKFKLTCVLRNVSMQGLVSIDWIPAWVEETEKMFPGALSAEGSERMKVKVKKEKVEVSNLPLEVKLDTPETYVGDQKGFADTQVAKMKAREEDEVKKASPGVGEVLGLDFI